MLSILYVLKPSAATPIEVAPSPLRTNREHGDIGGGDSQAQHADPLAGEFGAPIGAVVDGDDSQDSVTSLATLSAQTASDTLFMYHADASVLFI